MPSPSEQLGTPRPELGEGFQEFNLEAARQGFIATRVFPVFESKVASGSYSKIPVEQLLQKGDTRRAPGSSYNRGDFTWQKASFATEEHGSEWPVDAREAKIYGDWLDAEAIATDMAYSAVLSNLEKRVADLAMNTTTFASQMTTATAAWSNVATAKPITDIRKAKKAVRDRTGITPNALVLSLDAYEELLEIDQVLGRISSDGAGQSIKPSDLTKELIAQAVGVDMVLVGNAYVNNANKGQAADMGPVWPSTHALVAKVATTNNLREPCLGRVFHYGEDGSQIGGTVESYFEPQTRSEVIRVRLESDEQVIYTELGQLISGI